MLFDWRRTAPVVFGVDMKRESSKYEVGRLLSSTSRLCRRFRRLCLISVIVWVSNPCLLLVALLFRRVMENKERTACLALKASASASLRLAIEVLDSLRLPLLASACFFWFLARASSRWFPPV